VPRMTSFPDNPPMTITTPITMLMIPRMAGIMRDRTLFYNRGRNRRSEGEW
jgi:hypothetical protein